MVGIVAIVIAVVVIAVVLGPAVIAAAGVIGESGLGVCLLSACAAAYEATAVFAGLTGGGDAIVSGAGGGSARVDEEGGITMGKSAHVTPNRYPVRGGEYSPFGKVKTPEGMWDVAVHGDNANGFMKDPELGSTAISPADLATEVRAAGWNGEPVRLLACRAACGTGAQEAYS